MSVGDTDSRFPARRLVTALGPEVSRLLILQRFSATEAQMLSDDAFLNGLGDEAVHMAFVQDAVTEEYHVRPEFDSELIHAVGAIYPRIAAELAERIIPRVIGLEILDTQEFIQWMIRNRLHSIARSSVASLATFSPFELSGVTRQLARSRETLLLRRLLKPYGAATRRWFAAIGDSASDLPFSVGPESFVALVEAESGRTPPFHHESRNSPYLDGFLPIAGESRPHGLPGGHGIDIRSTPALYGDQTDVGNVMDRLLRPALTAAPGPDYRGTRGTPTFFLGDSSEDLLRLVLSDRGPTQTTERVDIELSRRLVTRNAEVGVTATAVIDGRLFAYLGTLPSSAGSAAPLDLRSIDGERLVSGGGPTISVYIREVSRLLGQLGESSDVNAISASDWARIRRSVRESWRFVSTSREYVDISVVSAQWQESLSDYAPDRLPWPFEGSAASQCTIEGFRHGNDDDYAISFTSSDAFTAETVELDAIPRPRDTPTLERPTRIRATLRWDRRGFSAILVAALVGSALSLVVGTASVSGEFQYVDYNQISLSLSLFSTFVSPVAAYFVALATRREGGLLHYRNVTLRIAGILAVLMATTLLSVFVGSDPALRLLSGGVNMFVGAYLGGTALLALVHRGNTHRRVAATIDDAYHAAEAARVWSFSDVRGDGGRDSADRVS